MALQEIIKLKKEICGTETGYLLSKERKNVFSIEITRNSDLAKEDFYGDFFDVVRLFEIIFNTNTLPENLSEIAYDVKNSIWV